ncbi:fasciclin domain-containing protein [Nostoc sp. UHCC 0926]|uniref:fasciclin domain-containing protein n=1 Tax=unclassified Nostoc TaxID=2593658 RepID=UPI002361125F|nr:fasciclin domain-containing protein [Nostoc sp. UHCC 0926]WDD32600.1 fasciclin domain-containing protein [Nostoc sp. UHCC 0926]
MVISDVAMKVPINMLVAALKAAKGVDTFKGNSLFTVFVPADNTFTQLQASTIDALLKDIAKLNNISIL